MTKLKIEMELRCLRDVNVLIGAAIHQGERETVIKMRVDDLELNFTECKHPDFPNLSISAPDIDSVKRFRSIAENYEDEASFHRLYRDVWDNIYYEFLDYHNCAKISGATSEVANEQISKLQESPDYIYNWTAQFIVEALDRVRSPVHSRRLNSKACY